MPDLFRRSYQVREDKADKREDLKNAKVEVAVIIGGKVHTRIEARRPGMLAVLGRADGSFDIEIVETQQRTTDVRVADERQRDVLPWQVDAMKPLVGA